MSGRDLHLPRLRLVAARGRSSSSSSLGSSSSSGCRGSSSIGRGRAALAVGSSSSSLSSRTEPSDHAWDSPRWRRQRLSPSTPLVTMEKSPYSCWTSTSSSEREKRRSAAAAAAEGHAKNIERILSINRQRYVSLISPPTRHSPEDFDRIYHMGIYKAKDTRTIYSTPEPCWSSDGYEFVKSGGASPTEPGFSLPFVESGPASSSKGRKGKAKKTSKASLFVTRKLFLNDDADVDRADSV